MSNYRRSSGGTSRWMNLRYAGTCKVCGVAVPAGTNAFWDAGARTVTCYNIACCEADGLTTQEWKGSPVSGQFVAVRAARRIGAPAPSVITTVFNSGAVVTVNRNGRCEDAPCCGCCT